MSGNLLRPCLRGCPRAHFWITYTLQQYVTKIWFFVYFVFAYFVNIKCWIVAVGFWHVLRKVWDTYAWSFFSEIPTIHVTHTHMNMSKHSLNMFEDAGAPSLMSSCTKFRSESKLRSDGHGCAMCKQINCPVFCRHICGSMRYCVPPHAFKKKNGHIGRHPVAYIKKNVKVPSFENLFEINCFGSR